MSENQEFDFESFLQNSGQQSQIELNETLTENASYFQMSILMQVAYEQFLRTFPDIGVGRSQEVPADVTTLGCNVYCWTLLYHR